jgi:hypothetical protein
LPPDTPRWTFVDKEDRDGSLVALVQFGMGAVDDGTHYHTMVAGNEYFSVYLVMVVGCGRSCLVS